MTAGRGGAGRGTGRGTGRPQAETRTGAATRAGLVLDRVSGRYRSDLHDERTAAWLGLALGVTFATCFLTGLWSHLAQDPPPWFTYPSRPAGLYRVTQGIHVTTGTAAIPLLVAKLWVVHPHLWAWPPVRSALHAAERLALLPLVGGAAFLLLSGTANVARWYPWSFFFPRAHFWAAWVTVGALVVHVGAKAGATRAALARRGEPVTGTAAPAVPDPVAGPPGSTTGGDQTGTTGGDQTGRRAFLGGVAAASAALVVATVGGTVSPLERLSVLAQRRPHDGPQGLPVNKSAVGAGVVDLARAPGYRLVVDGAVAQRLSLTPGDLRSLPQHSAELPIACVEGWSASARWRGVPVRHLLELAGAAPGAEVVVESLQPRGRYRTSILNPDQAADPDTLLALDLDGAPLHLDHGYPVRLVGPNRPGVQQTKWVGRLVVR